MILVDLDDLEIKKYADELSDMTYDMNLDYDVMIMPIVKNEKHFNYWLESYPFYNNVTQRGGSFIWSSIETKKKEFLYNG
jgi:hypothetical protein